MVVLTLERTAALLLVITGIQVHIGQCQLVVLSECTCPGRELRLGCTVVGGSNTIWKGTAFDCPGRGNEILLRHSQFSESGLAMGECNDGTIIGHGRNRTFDGFDDSKFTSQLTVNLPLLNTTSNTLEGETVECTREGGESFGTHTIAYTRNLSTPPPDNVHLAQVTTNALTFQWDPVQSICSYIQYKVNAEGCGVCPNTTLSESVTCAVNDILTLNESVCTLSVETMVCGFQSHVSETVTAMLKVPDHPSISKVLPYYNSTSSHLTKVDIQVERDSTEDDISDGISGSVTSYTFNIGFPDSETSCTLPASTSLSVSACMDGLCDVTITNLTSLPCSTNSSRVQVAVYASNELADGPPSIETLNTSNSLFFVEFEPLSCTFICRFVGQHESKSCEITYGPVDPTDQLCTSQLDNRIPLVNNSDTSNTVNVSISAQDLPAQTKSQHFCFTAIGETPQFTIAVEGMFTIEAIGTGTPGNTTLTPVTLIVIVAVISFVIIILLVVLIAALSIIVSKKKNYTLKQRDYTDNDEQQYDRTSFAQRQQRQVPMNHQQQTDEQQYDQTLFHAQQQPHRHNMVPVHEQQTEEQQYDQIFVQQQSRQPIANQQKPMIYSELGPTATAGKSNIFVPGGDDRIEYAELDHRRGHVAASDSAKIATSSLILPDREPGTFDGREDSPTPPPLPPKYECY